MNEAAPKGHEMRNMSFRFTMPQLLQGTKTVTRRLGWKFLKPGDWVCAVRQSRGLNRGQQVRRLGLLKVLWNDPVRLDSITVDDCAREGFGHMKPAEFVSYFCDRMRCTPDQIVQRIEFEFYPYSGNEKEAGHGPR